jgi:hypothetical protein
VPERFTNNPSTILAAAMALGDTTIQLVSAADFPTQAQYRLRVEDEIMLVTAGAGATTQTVTRGAEGTVAAAHPVGSPVKHPLTAGSLAQAIADATAATDAELAAHAADASHTNERVPTALSVTDAKIAAGLKPSGGAAAGTEALRALGTTEGTAAAGSDLAARQVTSEKGVASGYASLGADSLLPAAQTRPTVFYTVHNFVVLNEVKVQVGQTDHIPLIFLSLAPGQTAKLVKVIHFLNVVNTSATVKIRRNGVDAAGFTGMVVFANVTLVTPAAVALADNDFLSVVVTAIAGVPKNMTVTLVIEHTVAS